ncbi:MAG: hypothetical protein JJT78_16475, partial [Leptospira sp.]|nr:hypothetical protein [Leptospira sp.]
MPFHIHFACELKAIENIGMVDVGKSLEKLSQQNEWNDWKWQLRNQIRSLDQLSEICSLSQEELETFALAREYFDFGISPYYAKLIDPQDENCPIRLQTIPRSGELERVPGEVEDPLAEEDHMPVLGVTHRYPDRALWYLSHNCAV